MPPRNRIRQTVVSVDTIGWDEVEVPATAQEVRVKNTGVEDVRLRTDSADSTTQLVIPVGGSETWRLQVGFERYDVPFSLQAVSGTGTVLVTWLA